MFKGNWKEVPTSSFFAYQSVRIVNFKHALPARVFEHTKSNSWLEQVPEAFIHRNDSYKNTATAEVLFL